MRAGAASDVASLFSQHGVFPAIKPPRLFPIVNQHRSGTPIRLRRRTNGNHQFHQLRMVRSSDPGALEGVEDVIHQNDTDSD
jgi:hypothetical protein